MRKLNAEAMSAAVAGGSVLAAGGGGWVDHGLMVGGAAVNYGEPKLVDLDELPESATIATVTAIGAPAARDWKMRPRDYVRALELLMQQLDEPVVGTITAQNGSSTTLNGWIQSAVMGTFVVDAAGDGRAHPTGKMGSMGLAADPEHETVMTAAGGDERAGRYLEVVTRGGVARTANVLRTAAVESGGFIAAARNPLPASYIRKHAAVGAISYALNLGEAMISTEKRGGEAVMRTVADTLGGRLLARGPVSGLNLKTRGGWDIGGFRLDDGIELSFVNEYMTVESGGERLATFPDLITTLSPQTGRPVSIAQLREGTEVCVLVVGKERLPLGEGVKEPSVYPEVEAMLGKDLQTYALA